MRRLVLTLCALLAMNTASFALVNLPEVIREGDNSFLTVRFEDHNKQPVVPSHVEWRVYDEATGVELYKVTESTLAATMTLELLPQANQIVDPRKSSESHIVHVIFKYQDNARTGTDQARYDVENVAGLAVGCGPTPTGTPDSAPCGPTPLASFTATRTRTPTQTPTNTP